jgi:hypothetical protein
MTTLTLTDSTTALVLAREWEWSRPPQVDYAIETEVETGLSGRESRREYHAELRVTVRAELLLMDLDEVNDLRDTLAERTMRRVILPLWMDKLPPHRFEAERVHRTDYALGWDGGDQWTMVSLAGVQIAALPYRHLLPFVVGHLDDTTTLQMITPAVARCRIVLTEDSPVDYAVRPTAAGSTVWPSAIVPNWSRVDEQSIYEVDRYEIGRGRKRAIGKQETRIYRGLEAGCSPLDRAEVGSLLAHFRACAGAAAVWSVPWWSEPGTTLQGRYAQKPLTLSWLSGGVVSTRIRLVETPWAGTIAERRPQTAHCYRITYESPTPAVWRFTDYERTLTMAGQEYEPRAIEHGPITEGFLGDNNRVEIVSEVWDGNPMLKFMPHSIDAPMAIEIHRVAVETGSSVLLWSGYLQSASLTDRKISAKATAFGGLLERAFPSVLMQRQDNASLFSPANGLSAAAWQQVGAIASMSGTNLSVSGISGTPGYYTGGWIEVGDGATYELRTVIHHQGNQIRIAKPLRYAGPGSQVRAFPGYDGDWSTALDKYNNTDNFLGFPHVPDQNPTLTTTQQEQRGKK